MRLLPALLLLASCLGPVLEPPRPSYHNPLDDGGVTVIIPPGGGPDGGDAGLPAGPTVSEGAIDGRRLALTSAIYLSTGGGDAGAPDTQIFLSDAPDFCAQLLDGGLRAPWNVVSLYLAGDVAASYPIASILPPAGATARFDWEDGDGGSFGFEIAGGGQIDLASVDPNDAQPATGGYSADFADAGLVIGRFVAAHCSAVPPRAGE